MDYNQIKIGGTIVYANVNSTRITLRVECKYYLTEDMYETNTFLVEASPTIFLNDEASTLKEGEYVHVEGHIRTMPFAITPEGYATGGVLVADTIKVQEDEEEQEA